MSDTLIQLACLAILLIVGAFWLSVGSVFRWNAEADGVLRSGFNATGIIEPGKPQTRTVEDYRQNRPPVLNQGKAKLPCAECQDPKWTLTDYRDSPMFKPGGIYSGHIGPDGNWELDNRKIVEAPFRRKP